MLTSRSSQHGLNEPVIEGNPTGGRFTSFEQDGVLVTTTLNVQKTI